MVPSTRLPLRQVGKNGAFATQIGFGAMGMSVAYGTVFPTEDRLMLLDRAWELGCTNWDTAALYGDSEEVIGEWFKRHPERRADIFLATKFGFKKNDAGIVVDASPEHCLESAEQSLKCLNVTCIDLFYMHRTNGEVPIEKTVGAMKKLQDEGKVKYLGLSEVSSNTLRRAYTVAPISAVQVEYNPWTLDIEGSAGTHLLQTCKELGVAVFAYSPLGRGLLTGRFRSIDDFDENDSRRRCERFQGDNFVKNLQLVDKFNEIAKTKGCTPAQLVLAWLLAQYEALFVIPGTKNTEYLEQNVGAADVKLSGDEEKAIRSLVEEAGVHGGRNPFAGSFHDTVPLE
ncbi:aldo/keto reductase family domain-containing protein [Trichoderma breve]|uniref:Aldo/keto reductase family domain-containing protein n=1 Tax=Trichoderma breve TaxID=2034170 RepID=A0A9W9BMW6_9HYPO|nr:aldo/keto reductase family domain-containing protein [Trichoderma breve]KAJ4862741.1 aldo/keto reductase family domain-containing protein [Trichoderma breve]